MSEFFTRRKLTTWPTYGRIGAETLRRLKKLKHLGELKENNCGELVGRGSQGSCRLRGRGTPLQRYTKLEGAEEAEGG